MTSQWTDLIKWPIYPYHSVQINVHIDTYNKVLMTPVCRTSATEQLWLVYFHIDRTRALVDDIHYLELFGTTTIPSLRRYKGTPHIFILLRAVEQLRHAAFRGVFVLNYAFYRWTRQRIHNTVIVVDRYLRLMENKWIPDSEEPRLESLYPPFVSDNGL